MTAISAKSASGRRTGRPVGGHDSSIPWSVGREMRLHGSSYAEIARALGVSKAVVGRRAVREGWKLAGAPVAAPPDTGRTPASMAPDVVAIVDRCLTELRAQVEGGVVRSDVVTALDRAVRLKRFIEEAANDDKATVPKHLPTLEELAEHHRLHRTRMAEIQAAPELAGVLSEGAGDDIDGGEEHDQIARSPLRKIGKGWNAAVARVAREENVEQ